MTELLNYELLFWCTYLPGVLVASAGVYEKLHTFPLSDWNPWMHFLLAGFLLVIVIAWPIVAIITVFQYPTRDEGDKP